MEATTIYVLLVIFVATLIRSAFGFGEALIAVPLLAIRLPVNVAAPLAVLVSITVAAAIIVQDWQSIHVRSAGWLVTSTLFGIPLGLLLLTQGNPRLVKGVLAVIIVALLSLSLPTHSSAANLRSCAATVALGSPSAASSPECWEEPTE